jgi:hypothetical protein
VPGRSAASFTRVSKAWRLELISVLYGRSNFGRLHFLAVELFSYLLHSCRSANADTPAGLLRFRLNKFRKFTH